MSAVAKTPPSDASVPDLGLRARYFRVLVFFAGVVLGVLWWDIFLRRVGLRRLSQRTAPSRYARAARRFRALAIRLGGVWIKVGQFLSARVDVLPEAITRELVSLQDEVPPESFPAIRAVVASAFDEPLEAIFPSFDAEPLASASLGQVHRARLHEGDDVVVKVQRPRIHQILRVDLAALERVIGWLKRYRPINRRADLDALFEEFSRTLWEEVDYLAEAENARRFSRMFSEEARIRIPEVYERYTTKTVLTLEDVYFIKITDYAAIEGVQVERAEVADRLFRTYLRQIFEEGFFHADPHPGNLFVEQLEEGHPLHQLTGGWRLVFVDFGMVGQVTPEIRDGLRDLAIAFGRRELDRLMLAYQKMGVLLPGADLERIREAEGALFDRLWGKSMRELVQTHPQEMRRFASEFRDVLYEMPFQVPEDLIFLGRCVAILSGMCTGLNPDFNLFEGMAPFAQRLLTEEGGDGFEDILSVLLEQLQALSTLPARLDRTLTRVDRGEVTLKVSAASDLQRDLKRLNRSVDRLVSAVIFAALLMVSGLLYINGEVVLGLGGMALSLLAILWTLRGRRLR